MKLRKNGKINLQSIKYPKFTIKFFNGEKLVNTLSTKKTKRILFRIRGFGAKNEWSKCFLRFSYTPKYHNEGYYTNVKDLEHAFRCFEELLVEFAL